MCNSEELDELRGIAQSATFIFARKVDLVTINRNPEIYYFVIHKTKKESLIYIFGELIFGKMSVKDERRNFSLCDIVVQQGKELQ